MKGYAYVWSLRQETRSWAIACYVHITSWTAFLTSRIENASENAQVMDILRSCVLQEGDTPCTSYKTPFSTYDWFREEVNTRIHYLLYLMLLYSYVEKFTNTPDSGKFNAKPGARIPRMVLSLEAMVSVEDVVRTCFMTSDSRASIIGASLISFLIYILVEKSGLSASAAYSTGVPQEMKSEILRHMQCILRCVRASSTNLPVSVMQEFRDDENAYIEMAWDTFKRNASDFRLDRRGAVISKFSEVTSSLANPYDIPIIVLRTSDDEDEEHTDSETVSVHSGASPTTRAPPPEPAPETRDDDAEDMVAPLAEEYGQPSAHGDVSNSRAPVLCPTCCQPWPTGKPFPAHVVQPSAPLQTADVARTSEAQNVAGGNIRNIQSSESQGNPTEERSVAGDPVPDDHIQPLSSERAEVAEPSDEQADEDNSPIEVLEQVLGENMEENEQDADISTPVRSKSPKSPKSPQNVPRTFNATEDYVIINMKSRSKGKGGITSQADGRYTPCPTSSPIRRYHRDDVSNEHACVNEVSVPSDAISPSSNERDADIIVPPPK